MRLGWPLIVVDAAAWAAVQIGTGYLVHRLPESALRVPPVRSTRLYRRLGVPRWKRLLPEGGAVFKGGFDKRRLRSRADLPRHHVEAKRAELGHWLALSATPLFWLWNPLPAAVVATGYGVVVNVPPILSQRYNRVRLERLQRKTASR